MKADLEITLTHDGRQWVGWNDVLIARGESLQELDRAIHSEVSRLGLYPKGATFNVFMVFDYDTIPTWIRQYAAHYFNRTITLTI